MNNINLLHDLFYRGHVKGFEVSFSKSFMGGMNGPDPKWRYDFYNIASEYKGIIEDLFTELFYFQDYPIYYGKYTIVEIHDNKINFSIELKDTCSLEDEQEFDSFLKNQILDFLEKSKIEIEYDELEFLLDAIEVSIKGNSNGFEVINIAANENLPSITKSNLHSLLENLPIIIHKSFLEYAKDYYGSVSNFNYVYDTNSTSDVWIVNGNFKKEIVIR